MKIRIYYEDTDSQGIVYHANYIKFCERARSEIFFNSGLNIFSNSSYFVISQINAKFISPAKLGDEIFIKTICKNIRLVSVDFLQEIYKDQDLIFSAELKAVHMNNSRPCKISNEILNFLKKIENNAIL